MIFSRPSRACTLAAILLTLALASSAIAQQIQSAHPLDMTVVRPESVGFSSERLERLHNFMQQAVDNQQVAGIVTILSRHGKVVDYRAYGYQDLASKTRMAKDTIFRDYSMTKPGNNSANEQLCSKCNSYIRFSD
jgi:CubicO group peptidase (beta-lactamase class C family)